MSDECTPTLEDAKRTYAYIQGGLDHDDGYTPFYQVHEEAFDRMIAALIREAKAEALEEFAGQMATGFNQQTLNAERRAIKREARTRAAEHRERSET